MRLVQCTIVTFILALSFSICSPFLKVRNPALIIHNTFIYLINLPVWSNLLCHCPFLLADIFLISLRFSYTALNSIATFPPLLPPPSCQHGHSLYFAWNLNPKARLSSPLPSHRCRLTPTGLWYPMSAHPSIQILFAFRLISGMLCQTTAMCGHFLIPLKLWQSMPDPPAWIPSSVFRLW